MPNTRIEIENYQGRWHAETEMGRPLRRRALRADSFHELIAQLVAQYEDATGDVAPKAGATKAPQGDTTPIGRKPQSAKKAGAGDAPAAK